jgi:hypothetical protein
VNEQDTTQAATVPAPQVKPEAVNESVQTYGGEWSAAFVLAQGKMKSPRRNRKVTVRPKNGSAPYSFFYATLDSIMDEVRPHLAASGLGLTFQTIGEVCFTRLLHASGQYQEVGVPLVLHRDAETGKYDYTMREYGSALTYARRYGTQLLLGLAADEDDDGNAADGNEAHAEDRTAPAGNAPAAPAAAGTARNPGLGWPAIAKPEQVPLRRDDKGNPIAAVVIVSCEALEKTNKNGRKYTKFVAVGSDRQKYTTIDRDAGKLLQDYAKQPAQKVFVTYKVSAFGGERDVLMSEPIREAPAQAPAAPAADIPERLPGKGAAAEDTGKDDAGIEAAQAKEAGKKPGDPF